MTYMIPGLSLLAFGSFQLLTFLFHGASMWPFSPDYTLDINCVKSKIYMLMAKRHIIHAVLLLHIKK